MRADVFKLCRAHSWLAKPNLLEQHWAWSSLQQFQAAQTWMIDRKYFVQWEIQRFEMKLILPLAEISKGHTRRHKACHSALCLRIACYLFAGALSRAANALCVSQKDVDVFKCFYVDMWGQWYSGMSTECLFNEACESTNRCAVSWDGMVEAPLGRFILHGPRSDDEGWGLARFGEGDPMSTAEKAFQFFLMMKESLKELTDLGGWFVKQFLRGVCEQEEPSPIWLAVSWDGKPSWSTDKVWVPSVQMGRTLEVRFFSRGSKFRSQQLTMTCWYHDPR